MMMFGAAVLVSCRQTSLDVHGSFGTLTFNVDTDSEYIVVETKSDDAIDFDDIANYDVVIDGPTYVSKKFSEFAGKPVELGSGHYSITITSPATLPAAFDQPIYRAYDEFDIAAGEVTALNLTCTPYNCKVTIELTENFKKELATYEVFVSNGLGSLVWTKNASQDDFAANKVGYFTARALEIKVKGHRSIDNVDANAIYYIKETLPADHHIIKLDAKVTGQIGGGADGAPGVSITVSTQFNEKDQNVSVDGMDETYVDRPDFGDDDVVEVDETPSIVWDANPFFDPYSITPDSQISMKVKAPRGFKTFKVEVSENFKPALAVITKVAYICELDENGDLIWVDKKDKDGNLLYEQAKDANGDPIFDEDNNPVYVKDEEGKPVVQKEMVKKNFGTADAPIYKTLEAEGVDYIDLIEHPYAWHQFGLPVGTQVKGQTEIVFELTPFISTLCSAAGGMTVQFILKASDIQDEFVYLKGTEDYPVVTMIVPEA